MPFTFFEKDAIVGSNELLWAGILFGGIFLLFFLLKWISKWILSKMGTTHTRRRNFLELFSGISSYSQIAIPLFFASLALPFVKRVHIVFSALLAIALVIEISAFGKFILTLILDKSSKSHDAKTKKNLTEIFNTILQVVVWIVVLLIFFDTIGVAITPLLASLGVWGIAVAFAAQKLLEDFFASFSIMGTTPFRIGDIITIDSNTWTVQKIWLRTTSLQTVEGKTIIVPNRLILANIVENSGTIKMRKKRFSLILPYETSIKKLRILPEKIEKLFATYEEIKFERALLKDAQEAGLEILISYVVKSDDRLFATKIHEKVLLDLLELLEKEKIEITSQLQKLLMKK